MMFAPGKPYDESHRHFSSVMAIHPLGLIKWEDGPAAQTIIKNSIRALDSVGPSLWCGYSYSWLANLKARAKDGDGAARALEIFSKAFCLKNSFHVNGDQTKSGYSTFTYRPFTLEGNFAFAAGLQEMLLQSYAGFIEVFPAVPGEWKDISFNTLRAEGGFLVSGKKANGNIVEIKISTDNGGTAVLKLPSEKFTVSRRDGLKDYKQNAAFVELIFDKPGSATLFFDSVAGINP
jgi:alpha-L-fucosidase 2